MVLFLLSPVSTFSPFHLGVFYLLDSLAFGFGIITLIGGIRRGRAEIVRLAVLGTLLSGFPLAIFLYCVLQ